MRKDFELNCEGLTEEESLLLMNSIKTDKSEKVIIMPICLVGNTIRCAFIKNKFI